MVYDFDDVGEGDFNNLAVGTLHLDAGLGESLRRLHTTDDAAHAAAVLRDDFNIVMPIKRFEGGESFGDFHLFDTALSFRSVKVYSARSRQVRAATQ